MEDEVKHMAEALNIKIEVEGNVDDTKETIEITEKIKKVIEESFGKEANETVNYMTPESAAIIEFCAVEGKGTPVKVESKEDNVLEVVKVDYSTISNEDYEDIAADSDHDSLELEELAENSRSEEDMNKIEETLKVFAKEIEKIKSMPKPGSESPSKFSFDQDIKSAFKNLLPSQFLDKLTPNRCGLCHEDFTSEHHAWKHYTGYNHRRTVKYFINGNYKDHPSFYNMVIDAIHNNHPKAVTEKDIFDFIKHSFPVGDDDSRTKKLIRQRGLSSLLQIEYVVNEDGLFSATQQLLGRKKRSQQLLEKTDSVEVEPVKDIEIVKRSQMNPSDLKQFKDQMFDFSKKDLPKSVIETLTPDHCGLCQLEIYCKPWSHYTGAGHRTTVDLYQSGSYLGHPPYHTMIEKYIKDREPGTLEEADIVEYIRKNFNVGEDLEKVKARVEMSVSLLKKKKNFKPKKNFPSDNLIWFKKDSSSELCKEKPNVSKKVEEIEGNSRNERPRIENYRDSVRGHKLCSQSKNEISSKRKIECYDRKNSGRPWFGGGDDDLTRTSSSETGSKSNRLEVQSKRSSAAVSVRYSVRSASRHKRSPEQKEKLSDKRNSARNQDIRGRSPERRRSRQKVKISPRRNKSRERRKRSLHRGHTRSPKGRTRSPDKRTERSKKYQDHKRYRKSNGSDEVSTKERKNHSRHQSKEDKSRRSSKSPRSKYDAISKPGNYSRVESNDSMPFITKSPTGPVISSQVPVNYPSLSADPMFSFTNPSPPPGSLPPDYMMAVPNLALQVPAPQAQVPFPTSFLSQHPQFPHVFILNSMGMGGQMGSQMMMPLPIGQHYLPNQPSTL